jgi:mycothiol synthase
MELARDSFATRRLMVFAFAQANPDDWLPAFNLAFRRLPDAERRQRVLAMVQMLHEGMVAPRGIWLARTDGRICGVHVCVPLGGGSCLFWLPEAGDDFEPSDLRDRLVELALARCRQEGMKLAEALVPPRDAALTAPLLRQGFVHITQLHYLSHDLHQPIETPTPASLRVETLSPDNEEMFQQTLLRTYEGTLDCPELTGVRSLDEIVAGLKAAGPYRPERWWLAFLNGAPAAVIVLTPLPEGPVWDLSYLGVVPECRGSGLGRALVQRAIRKARQAGALELILAVDARNTPALRLYRAVGFVESDLRDVYLHFFNATPSHV